VHIIATVSIYFTIAVNGHLLLPIKEKKYFFDMIRSFYARKLIMKKELTIFVSIFLLLAIGMHFKEWASHPIEHLKALPDAGAYGIGPVHPLVFTLAVYVVFVLLRGIVRLFRK
jgi:hypothetical protein